MSYHDIIWRFIYFKGGNYMKRTLIATSMLSIMLMITACSGNTTGDTQKNTAENATSTIESTTAPEITTESPKSNEIGLGETGTISNWNVTINKISFKDQVSDNEFTAFTPDSEGNKFLIIELQAENTGKEAAQFLPSFSINDDINAKVFFGDGFEFSMTNLLGYEKNLLDSTINPLSSKSGEIAFEVPKKVYDSKEALTLNFSAGNDELIVKLR